MTDKDILALGFFLAIPIYVVLWYQLNKWWKIDLPILPERYYDDPLKTLMSAGLTVGSLVLGFLIIFIFSLL